MGHVHMNKEHTNNKDTQIPGSRCSLDDRLSVKIALFILLVALMIAQDTRHMAERMFWFDEVSTFLAVVPPFWEIPLFAAVTSGHMQPPLFYWVGHGAAQLGTDPVTLRSVSVFFYILMIGFVIFFIRELHLLSRILLCLVLIITPFAGFAATEFRPYAFSAFTILLSSIFLYRLLHSPPSWAQASAYGFSALLLQYSLTLNCFVFGIQMLFISSFMLISFRKIGISESLKKFSPTVVISIFLCVQYLIFLIWITSNQFYYIDGSLVVFFDHVVKNSTVLLDILFINSWTGYAIIGFFVSGCVFGFFLNPWVTLYLLSIFAGQLYFSTYMTYASLPWFAERYLVASYVVFAVICALGAEALFRRTGRKTGIGISALLLIGPMYGGITGFSHSLSNPMVNAGTAHIENLRCEGRKTLVLSDPLFISLVPWYAYRNDASIIVHELNEEIDEVISSAVNQKQCIVLQEQNEFDFYSGKLFEKLNGLADYSRKFYKTETGYKFLVSVWLYKPN